MLLVLLSAGVGLVAIVAALHALLTKRDSTSALAWITVCLAIPVAGPLAYLVFGINRVRARAQRAYLPGPDPDAGKLQEEAADPALLPLALVGKSVTGAGLRNCDQISVLENGEGFYPRLQEDIGRALRYVYCSTYIFQNDATGKAVVEALAKARDRGLDVRIIVDGVSGLIYPPGIGRLLKKHGLNFRYFNPVTLVPPSLHINMRNHRKIIVLDGDVAYTGGQNISARHMLRMASNKQPTQDLHFRMRGRIVEDLALSFLRDWGEDRHAGPANSAAPARAEPQEAGAWARLVLSGPNENLDKLNEVLVGALALARRRIWIMTPYFLPGLDLVGALVGARLRGVDVKVVLPSRTNVHLAHWAAQHNLKFILGRNIKVYLQQPPFNHTKLLLIDDNYSLVGSANLDPRSLRLNFELGVEVFGEDFNEELSVYVSRRLERSIQADIQQLESRPYWMKIRDALAWLFSPYL